jgi:PmbA protein
LGTQIAATALNLCDDALHPANVAAETFDSEGTPTRRVELIKEGIFD